MLEKKNEEILDSNSYLNKRKKARKHIKFNKDKRKVFIFSFAVSFIYLALIYFLSPFSDTYRSKQHSPKGSVTGKRTDKCVCSTVTGMTVCI